MSHHDYLMGQEIVRNAPMTFYGVIQAAMRMADTDNLEHLKTAWPTIWEELQVRYNAPGGYTEDELEALEAREQP